jgi:hypothetical protein
MPYIGNQPGTGVRNRFIYTATASQTTFTGADDNGKTLKYADSDFVDVYLNGICLVPVTDYTSTSKTSVVLTQAASLNDTLEVVAYDIATIADTVSKADGGTFNGDLGITNASPDITLANNTTEDTDGGRESTVTFKGLQSGSEESTLAEIRARHDGTADDEKGELILKTNDGSDGASPTERMRIDSLGHVGVNTSSPDANGFGAGNGILTVASDTGSAKTAMLNLVGDGNDTDATRVASLFFNDASATGAGATIAGIEAYRASNHATDPGADLIFNTNIGSTGGYAERMRIDSSGDVAIGTTDKGYPDFADNLTVADSANAGITIRSGTSSQGNIYFSDATGTGTGTYMGYISYNHSNNGMTFATGSSARMSILSDGKVAIGRTSALGNGLLTVQSNNGLGLAIGYGTGTNEYRRLYHHSTGLYFESSTNQAYLSAAGAWTNASDVTLKKDIEDIDYGIETTKKLKPRKYKMKSDDQEQVGFIAQELVEEVPEVVSGKDEILGVSYGQLTAVLTKAIQELSAKNDALEAQNTTQATQIADLITRVTALEAG